MSQVAMTNYEVNQQAYQQLPPLEETIISDKMEELLEWFKSFKKLDYVGILCRERHDYTLVHINEFNFVSCVQETIQLIEERGELLDIRYNVSGDYYECWVRERRTEAIAELEEKTPAFTWTPQVWMYIIFDATD